MKKVIVSVCLFTMLAGVAQAEWSSFVIRENGTEGAPIIQANSDYGVTATEFLTFASSQKAGLGCDIADGMTIGDLAAVSIDRLDDTSRFTIGSGPAVAPYFNIWVTDGSGNYAVIANEPSNAEWQPGDTQWDMTWDILKTKVAKAYENSAATAVGGWIASLDVDNDGLTFEDIAGLEIKAPSAAELSAGWTGLGTGAPRELGTNVAYDFNWVFGDTLSNYVSGETEGFVVASPSVSVPEPATLSLMLLGVFSLVGLRVRRK